MAVETLRQLQCRFASTLCGLILWANSKGYEIAFGETLRSDEQAEINAIGPKGRERISSLVATEFPLLADKITNNGKANGIRGSLHELKLAADLLAFKNGIYLTSSEDYRELGVEWERRGGCWGGHFNDGNHFSFEYGGKK